MTKPHVVVRLLGETSVRLWGLDLAEWQRRSWTKVGAAKVGTQDGRLLTGMEWVLSPALQRTLLATPGAALLVEDGSGSGQRLAALHLPDEVEADRFAGLVGQTIADPETLRAAGLTPGNVNDFADPYDKALRKREAPYALSLQETPPHKVERVLFKGSYKGVTDLVTKYAWPIPAFHATRLAARLHLSPNMVTTASLGFVCLAFWFFWIGAWLPGILAAWSMTFLDTVDGKLARTTMTYSRWGNIYDHGIDLIHPPFWYWAIFHGLMQAPGGPSDGLLFMSLGAILVGYVLNRLEEGFFMRYFGFHIHVWRPIDSRARVITARRNPNMLIFMLAVLVGQPGWGFVAIAVWTILCLVFHGVRLFQALAQPDKPVVWMES
ncbi:CDP-alcohol phosphatidyltransferase family protein [Hyphomonas johnsonii]|uniref:Putative phosphatidyltransferase n=1 Tax=Hyphomonas johnsonii MHS-2 TaxID=1280950 RepID=A0A059FBL6_9PROT|nr:CDP-alcohol phosphatidyltransferase family protein [Hyphomonas johnsonii]KCZ87933.1 putative phosphatidyltransferase [Hyphomonas johnsonii MHS-2]